MVVKTCLIPNDFYVESKGFEAVLDEVCIKEGVKYIEIAYLWGKSILDLNESEVAKLHEALDQRGIKIGSIQTQVMKVIPDGAKLSSPGSKNMHRDRAFNTSCIDPAIKMAKEFGAKYIVTYSYFNYTMNKKQLAVYWDMLFKDYAVLVDKCKTGKCTMVLECEDDTLVGDTASYLKLFEHFKSPHLKANLDLANFMGHTNSFTREDFEKLFPHVEYFHVKDRVFRNGGLLSKGILKKLFGGKPAIFGTGMVPWKQVLPWFVEKGYDGILSVEPHVHGDDKFNDAAQCVRNLLAMLDELEIKHE